MTHQSHPLLLAQYFTLDPELITAIAVIIVLLIIIIVLVLRRKPTPTIVEPKELESPTSNLLEDRRVVDAPVEISDDMSLAEIKRAKAARIRSKSGAKRKTAVEATEDSKRMHEPESLARASEAALAKAADDADELEEGSGTVSSEPQTEDPLTAALKQGDTDDADPKDDGTPNFAVPQVKPINLQDLADATPAGDAPAEKAPNAEKIDVAQEAKRSTNNKIEALKAAVARQRSKPEESHTLQAGLAKTRSGFIDRLGALFKKDTLDDDLVNEVEEILYTADIGPKAASRIMEAIEQELHKDAKQDPSVVWTFVRNYVKELLSKRQDPIDTTAHKPFVFLMIGVNGVGKTTTIGKLASKFRHEGKSVLMVAGDTFRAAAVEQLEVWGERTGIEVYKGASEQDPASVVYEGIEKAVKDGTDIVICDTAGRLQSNANLLDELGKIGRVAGKVVDGAPHETLLVLDANTGQNALLQARKFNEAVNISGIVLTKLDGTAKGGIILGICDEIDIPIRYIGIGEGVEDLRPFNADEFVEALFM